MLLVHGYNLNYKYRPDMSISDENIDKHGVNIKLAKLSNKKLMVLFLSRSQILSTKSKIFLCILFFYCTIT
jgi:hypothetical protein